MKSKLHAFLSVTTLSLLTVTVSQALDYNYGSLTPLPFTLTATDQARDLSGNGTFYDNGFGGVYDRAPGVDRYFAHFDLSSLSGRTITGNINFNLVINAQWGGAINAGVLSTADNPWSFSAGTATPSFTAINDTAAVNGSFTTGQTAT